MDLLTLDNINKFTNLDDPNILNFELRLLKNNNDYLDYINYLETKTATTPEQYICLYLRLIIVYNNEINVATNLWKYLIKYMLLKIFASVNLLKIHKKRSFCTSYCHFVRYPKYNKLNFVF